MKRKPTELDKFLSDPWQARLFEREKLALAISELIVQHMNRLGIDVKKLSFRTASFVVDTKEHLDDASELTVWKIADIMHAMGLRLTVDVEPIEKGEATR